MLKLNNNLIRVTSVVIIISTILLSAMVAFTVEDTYAKTKRPKKVKGIKYEVRFTREANGIRYAKSCLSWKRVKKVKGYQVKVNCNSGFGWTGWKIVKQKKNRKTCEINNRSWAGPNMKIKVRAYRINKKGKKVFGKWSKTKYINARGTNSKVLNAGKDYAKC